MTRRHVDYHATFTVLHESADVLLWKRRASMALFLSLSPNFLPFGVAGSPVEPKERVVLLTWLRLMVAKRPAGRRKDEFFLGRAAGARVLSWQAIVASVSA